MPKKSEGIICPIIVPLYGPLMDQGWALTLLGSVLVSLESIGMFFGA